MKLLLIALVSSGATFSAFAADPCESAVKSLVTFAANAAMPAYKFKIGSIIKGKSKITLVDATGSVLQESLDLYSVDAFTLGYGVTYRVWVSAGRDGVAGCSILQMKKDGVR